MPNRIRIGLVRVRGLLVGLLAGVVLGATATAVATTGGGTTGGQFEDKTEPRQAVKRCGTLTLHKVHCQFDISGDIAPLRRFCIAYMVEHKWVATGCFFPDGAGYRYTTRQH